MREWQIAMRTLRGIPLEVVGGRVIALEVEEEPEHVASKRERAGETEIKLRALLKGGGWFPADQLPAYLDRSTTFINDVLRRMKVERKRVGNKQFVSLGQ